MMNVFLSLGCLPIIVLQLIFFFNATATTEIYTLSLHDALPIFDRNHEHEREQCRRLHADQERRDRKSTRLNSSHLGISYAVFCLKKKNDTRANSSDSCSSPCGDSGWWKR